MGAGEHGRGSRRRDRVGPLMDLHLTAEPLSRAGLTPGESYDLVASLEQALCRRTTDRARGTCQHDPHWPPLSIT